MSGATTGPGGGDKVVTVNFKLTQSFLDEIDETWQGRGFNSRSEYIRYALRDATENPTFDRDELVALLKAEEAVREERTTRADEAREKFGTNE
ncbi:ribbon-helix-helix domain-containing protein [Halococcoides cellulosivorans]|uniref:CopG family transcriptional regulator n=1 Tax=Halococcoides cellulosivorans TaxID=1679096 RepID=A0A2R4WYP6_9EURY|nr:ribbon-helix-helix domain-containing protein [Halococcoides cellulosivorans]AWB26652.1 CopG family transcriptional regulator [Halococcoides cellulosivorans]